MTLPDHGAPATLTADPGLTRRARAAAAAVAAGGLVSLAVVLLGEAAPAATPPARSTTIPGATRAPASPVDAVLRVRR